MPQIRYPEMTKKISTPTKPPPKAGNADVVEQHRHDGERPQAIDIGAILHADLRDRRRWRRPPSSKADTPDSPAVPKRTGLPARAPSATKCHRKYDPVVMRLHLRSHAAMSARFAISGPASAVRKSDFKWLEVVACQRASPPDALLNAVQALRVRWLSQMQPRRTVRLCRKPGAVAFPETPFNICHRGELTNLATHARPRACPAPILLFRWRKEPRVREPWPAMSLPEQTNEMNPVALLTPTYGRDLELCTLLCESVDRHVTSFSKHYLLVPGLRPAAVRPFRERAPRRSSGVGLPARLAAAAAAHHPAQAAPVLVVAAGQAGERLACPAIAEDRRDHLAAPSSAIASSISDIVFFRDFDLARFEYPNPIPLLQHAQRGRPPTSRAIRAGSRPAISCSDCRAPPLPASDFIGHIIFWDQQTVRAMARGSRPSPASDWIEALCRTREFSEYMLYGYFVQNDAGFAAGHTLSLAHAMRQLLGPAEPRQR